MNRDINTARDPPPLFCLHCQYDLRGQPENRCPECGFEFDPVELCQIIYPDAKPIAGLDLAAILLYQSILGTVAASFLAVLGSVALDSPIPVLLSTLLLLVYLYQRADSVVPLLLARDNSTGHDSVHRKRFLFMRRWGVLLLMLFQIAVAIGTVILLSKLLIPDLIS
jgi:hypothetical protein